MTAPVRAGLIFMRGSKHASLWIVLAPRVLADLNASEATHLAADVGEGEHEGYVRLRLPEDGEEAFKISRLPAGNSVRIVLGHVPSLPNEKHEMRDAGHEIRDGALMITLPPFARSAAKPPAKTTEAAAPKKSAGMAAAPLKLSIEDSVFSQLAVKAGICFGCTRIEALRPTEDAHWDAYNAIARWMNDAGYADAVIRRKLNIASADDLADALAAPVERAKYKRFREMVAEALKLAGSPA